MLAWSWRAVKKLPRGPLPQGLPRPLARCRVARLRPLYRSALKRFADHIGKKPLRALTAQDVRMVLTDLAATHSTRTVVVAHNTIERAIRHAEANDYVRCPRRHQDREVQAHPCGCPSAPSPHCGAHRAWQAEQRLLAGELWQDASQ